MRDPPDRPTTDEVLSVVCEHWQQQADEAVYLPVGFGAHHWRVGAAPDAVFATFDVLGDRHSAATLEATYRAACELNVDGLVELHPPRPTRMGATTVALDAGAFSTTGWLVGRDAVDDRRARSETRAFLGRLHGMPAPDGLRRWRPCVGPDFALDLDARTRPPWNGGPFGAAARAMIRERLSAVATWTARYHVLAAQAEDRPWVPTHGEPDVHNQIVTAAGRRWVDWESLLLAPAERDTRVLRSGDPAMLELFDLDWRLEEIDAFGRWFASTHGDGDDDRISFAGLRLELTRTEFRAAHRRRPFVGWLPTRIRREGVP